MQTVDVAKADAFEPYRPNEVLNMQELPWAKVSRTPWLCREKSGFTTKTFAYEGASHSSFVVQHILSTKPEGIDLPHPNFLAVGLFPAAP
jgi:hypothetical protein